MSIQSYPGSDLTFLEVNEKNGPGRALKHCLRTDSLTNLPGDDIRKVPGSSLPYYYSQFNPVLVNEYRRMTMVSAPSPECITLDRDLSFHAGFSDIELSDVVIADIRERTGLAITSAEIMEIDFFRDSADLMITCPERSAIVLPKEKPWVLQLPLVPGPFLLLIHDYRRSNFH